MGEVRDCGAARLVGCCLAVAVAALLLLALPPRSRAAGEITGAALSRMLEAGPVDATGLVVDGDVDLGPLVRHSFRCDSCRLKGALLAHSTTFEGTVDLGGSELERAVDLNGSRFEGDLLAAGATFAGVLDLRDAWIMGRADFSLSAFASLATFESARLAGNVDFSLTRFAGDAVFAFGLSTASLTFERAIFGESADFSFFKFVADATFDGAQFKGLADFSNTSFGGAASFDHVRFGDDATFLVAQFLYAPNDPVDFAEAKSQGDLNFTFADFKRPTNFQDLAVKGTVSFGEAHATDGGLTFAHATAGAFVMSAHTAVASVRSLDRLPVLGMIEASAKAAGDLGLANDAHYASQTLRSHRDSFPLRVLDFVFYRTFAGYFVRPLNPLLTLLGLAALMTFAGAVRRGRTDSAAESLVGRAVCAARLLPGQLIQTLSLIGPARGAAAADKEARRVEVFVYRVLFACVLIGFANSNPTLRQMLDAAR